MLLRRHVRVRYSSSLHKPCQTGKKTVIAGEIFPRQEDCHSTDVPSVLSLGGPRPTPTRLPAIAGLAPLLACAPAAGHSVKRWPSPSARACDQ